MLSFPESIPLDAVQVVIDAFKGRLSDKKLIIQASCNLLFYALGQVVGSTVMNFHMEATEEQTILRLESLLDPKMKLSMGDFPWEQVAGLLFQLLKRWTAK